MRWDSPSGAGSGGRPCVDSPSRESERRLASKSASLFFVKLRVSLNPSWRRQSSAGSRRFWLLWSAAFSVDIRTDPLWLVEIYYRRLLVAVAVLGLTLYLAGATGLALWLDRNPYNRVGWTDLALPWKWDGLARKRGDAAIAQGLEQVRQRNFNAAYAQLRLGLTRSPTNIDGRLQLARLSAGFEPPRALQLLEEGLPYVSASSDYWQGLVSLYHLNEAFMRGLATLDGALAGSISARPQGDLRDRLETARARLLLGGGQPAKALEALEAASTPSTLSSAEKQARIVAQVTALTALGRGQEALVVTDRERAASPNPDPELLRAEAAACVTAGLEDRLRGALVQLRAADPSSPSAHAFAYDCWHRLRRFSYRDQAEAEFYQYFSRDDHALQVFSLMLAGLGDQDGLERVRKQAMASRFSPFAFDVRLTEVCLRRGNLAAAQLRLREWEDKLATLPRDQSFDPEFIRRLVHALAADTDGAAGALVRHLQDNRQQARPDHYRFAVDRLVQVGRLETADQVLKQAQAHYSMSEPLVAKRRELDAQFAARAGATPAQRSPAVDAALAALDDQLRQNALTEARATLQALRRANPAWLEDRAADFQLREIELDLAGNGAAADRVRIRRFLANHSVEAAAIPLLSLAEKLYDRQLAAAARLLRDEIGVARGEVPAVKAALAELAKIGDAEVLFADSAAAFRTIDAWMSAGHWDDAEQLMKQWRERPQPWAEGAQAELLARQVRLGFGVGRKPIALVDFRRLIMSAGEWRAAAFRVIREHAARGERETARLLAVEANRALPNDPEVEALLAELKSIP